MTITASETQRSDRIARLLTAVREVKTLWREVTRASFPAGVTGLGVLNLVDHEGAQRVSDLAACGHVGVSTMSRHVADLTAAGLLAREARPGRRSHAPRPADRRRPGRARPGARGGARPSRTSPGRLDRRGGGAAGTPAQPTDTRLATATGRAIERTRWSTPPPRPRPPQPASTPR